MPDKPAVLIVPRQLGVLTPMLESLAEVHRLWEGPQADTAATIRALVVLGEQELDRKLVESLPNLGLIACFTAGYDGIDVAWARGRGLQVSHAPAVNHEDVADHALGLLLAHRRGIVAGDRQVREGGWDPNARTISQSVGGARVGIVGLGAIGQAIARRCEAFGMRVSWWGPNPKPDATWPRAASLLELARASDVLIVACRADETNRGLISDEVIAALGPSGLLINVARGKLVDEDALIAALKAGRLGGAALDVFEDEPTPAARWRDVPNTVLTPHAGGATTGAVQGMVGLLLKNLAAYFETGRPATPAP
ncbi:2-hydroxyacid dehydrogenase [Brevundimonas sp. 2R-24]|uniref:2-hydroxyacid dehydrogenase n=1 Tax=Peiella sedimenti TaxID=3061083 RepID=A0ABT8SME0_9CAUL|nr:2-hydroxyacid dehydrogenase [Caulobacteraceae bacterium XZ-24]